MHHLGVHSATDRTMLARARAAATRRVRIAQWLPTYSRLDLVSDAIAGLTVGLTMMPQSIAYASLAELTAQYGLYSAFMGSFIYVVFGSIKEVSIGPTSLMALLCVSYTRDLPVDFVVLLALLAGCVELAMGLLGLGFLVDFISAPVVSGFTSATSVYIVVSQLKGLFGLQFRSAGVPDTLRCLLRHAGQVRAADTAVGLLSIAFLLCLRALKDLPVKDRRLKKALWFVSICRNALIVLICSLVSYAYHSGQGEAPFRLSGSVPSGLPRFAFPNTTATVGNHTYTFVEMCRTLGTGIVFVPLVAVLANVAIAKSFAAGALVDSSQEMMTLGLCNILGSFVQAMPTCGAFTRSAVSNASGVRTPMAGFYSGALILLALTFLTPYFYFIPKATLSAVLITAVVFMIDYQIVVPLWKSNKFDLFVTATTFGVSMVYGVESGLMVGVFINIACLLRLWARPTIHTELCSVAGHEYVLVRPELGLFFPAVDAVRQTVCKVARRRGMDRLPVLVDCSGILNIDYTAHKGIESLIKTFEPKTQRLVFVRLDPQILRKIQIITDVDERQFCATEQEALDAMFDAAADKTPSGGVTLPLLAFEDDKRKDPAQDAERK